MRAVLSQELDIKRVAVFAEMAWLQERPELGLICQSALNRGDVTLSVIHEVLPGLRDIGGKNILSYLKALGLIDERGYLTDLGVTAAKSNEVPVPEQGVYEFWLSEHPLMGCRILAIQRLASTKDSHSSPSPLPMKPPQNEIFTSLVDPQERFVLRDFPTNNGQVGCLEKTSSSDCTLKWTLNFSESSDEWRLVGEIDVPKTKGNQKHQSIQHSPESIGLDLWKLLEDWGRGPLGTVGRWDTKERRLRVSFESVKDDELDSFKRRVELSNVEVSGKGRFAQAVLEDIPTGPTDKADAQKWAMKRFERTLSSHSQYRTRTQVRELFAQLVEETPLESFAPMLPTHKELLSNSKKEPETYWALAAPVDLAPFEVSKEELDSLTIGGGHETQQSSSMRGFVRIPLGARKSMYDLLELLLDGRSPKHALLCDRYVRGENNLRNLKNLVATLGNFSNTANLHIWTGNEETDFSALQKITQTTPRGYRDIFRSKHPHDRYLIVVPSNGDPFGWQMTNSPLHALAKTNELHPKTILSWKDFAANLLSYEELEPEFQGWIQEHI